MTRKIVNFYNLKSYNTSNLDKTASNAIKNHFQLGNYNILLITWIKGLWTGVLVTLILHQFHSH